MKAVDEYKVSVLDQIYGYLCSCYSEPPTRFDFEYKDKNGTFAATFAKVEDDGHLVLRDNKGTERVYGFKEVEFVL